MKRNWRLLLTACFLFPLLLLTDPENAKGEPIEKTMTLMVYMIGSDLESGSGSATADIAEMQESGVDFSKVNILICTGGSKKWHRDDISAGEIGMYQLGGDGLARLDSKAQQSMGEPYTLASFLTDAYAQFPAEHFGLILWDHGNGPLIGYGMDRLNGNDSLELTEIRNALETSPFGSQNKLDFIGFDACLMSSAELVCTVDDYAAYLIASQEVEPSFGWNYGFLSECGNIPSSELVSSVIDRYAAGCEEFFSEKKFFSSDYTLAAMDLSRAAELEDGLNQVFAEATAEVSGDYPKLASQRIRTKGLGRATTGSEYDLVDLRDLMGYMSERYPKETKKVLDVLEQMIVKNGTNTENCCGLSIYYPYYNKKYYQKSWKETYQEIGLFPDYLTYLSRYDQIWLGTDMQEYFEGALVPSEKAKGEYTLQLTDEQQEHFASANYYLLRRTGDELYQPVHISSDVSNKKGLLKADFNGKVIYFTQNQSEKCIPLLTETDTAEGITYYDIISYFYDAAPETTADVEYSLADMFRGNAKIQISYDHNSEQISVKSVQKWNPDEEDELKSGKGIEIIPDEWRKVVFPNIPARYLTRDENGNVLPFYDWPKGDAYDGYEYYTSDGFSFTSRPIYDDRFEYFLMFEITDVQNNVYSSELLPVTLEKAPPEEALPAVEAEMDASGICKIYEGENLSVRLHMNRSFTDGSRSYIVSVENRNDEPVSLDLYVENINGSVQGGGYTVYAGAGQTVYQAFPVIYRNCSYAGFEVPESLTFSMNARNDTDKRLILPDTSVHLTFLENAAFHTVWMPLLDMMAEEQNLLETDSLRVDLLHAGYTLTGSEFSYRDYDGRKLTAALMAENTGNQEIYYSVKEIRLNEESFPCYSYGYLPPGTKSPVLIEIPVGDILEAGIESVSSAELFLGVDGKDAAEGLKLVLSAGM